MTAMAGDTTQQADEEHRRGSFSSRRVFILAAIGSAVGLGNIWRFPYVAYENGGGAFVVPYLVALLTAGIPFLLLDYAIGHRHRGSAPLSFARLRRGTEVLGWWQVGICSVIAVYYAAVIAWAVRYTAFSLDGAWGDDPEGFFFGEFLQAGDVRVTTDVVPGVLVPLALVWLAVLVIMALGVQRGIGATSVVFIPVLVLAFAALVVQALFLPGAGAGLDALFTPDWSALASASVWAAAFGQIFFSLSVGFGIMITYAAYVRRREDMVGSGLVVGFANSGFELLAGHRRLRGPGLHGAGERRGGRRRRQRRHRPGLHRLPDDHQRGAGRCADRGAVLRLAGHRRHHVAGQRHRGRHRRGPRQARHEPPHRDARGRACRQRCSAWCCSARRAASTCSTWSTTS